MQINKVKLTKDASEKLKQLKAKTGLTPNILSRIGFCLSIEDSSTPNPDDYPEEDREFNRYTLLGEWDDLYVGLLREKLKTDSKHVEVMFRAHINRGVQMLAKSVKSISDVAVLVSRTARDG